MQKIGGFIAEERKAKSFTQKELAAMLKAIPHKSLKSSKKKGII